MTRRSMRAAALATVALCATTAAGAQDITLKPLVDARLRLEQVDQDDLPKTAESVTLRLRTGVEATHGDWSALVESEATIGIDNDYNDTLNLRAGYPGVADPQNIELNRAQLRYATPSASVTVGRQRIELADQRFVGSSSHRQNQQTYDAVRATWAPLPRLTFDATYSWSDRTVNGIDGYGAHPHAIGGNNFFGIAAYALPIGILSGYAYLVDQDEVAVQGYRLSSQTYGGRFAGSRPLGAGLKLGYTASFARQSDYHRNPNDYAASYYLGEATLGHKLASIGVRYEVLGADHGTALTSVQTPLASLFAFQGWASKFSTTPPDGVRDLSGSAGLGWKKAGPLDSLALSAIYHTFDSDRLVRHYGDEIDLLATTKVQGVGVTVRYAHYTADSYMTDTDKFWLELEWKLG